MRVKIELSSTVQYQFVINLRYLLERYAT